MTFNSIYYSYEIKNERIKIKKNYKIDLSPMVLKKWNNKVFSFLNIKAYFGLEIYQSLNEII